ncbi:MAG TPA: outer membrane beta-barrel protein [Microvirga sp.]|nr:outer membrane beta-barrel protein [Microvirga sp.]
MNNNPAAPLNCTSGCTFTARDDGFQFGWALGAGAEYAVTNNLSLKVEYLHVDLGDRDLVYRAPLAGAAQQVVARSDEAFDVVRAGFNFRF